MASWVSSRQASFSTKTPPPPPPPPPSHSSPFLTPRRDLERFLRSLICLRDLFTVSVKPFCSSGSSRRRAGRRERGEQRSVLLLSTNVQRTDGTGQPAGPARHPQRRHIQQQAQTPCRCCCCWTQRSAAMQTALPAPLRLCPPPPPRQHRRQCVPSCAAPLPLAASCLAVFLSSLLHACLPACLSGACFASLPPPTLALSSSTPPPQPHPMPIHRARAALTRTSLYLGSNFLATSTLS